MEPIADDPIIHSLEETGYPPWYDREGVRFLGDAS